RAARAASSSVSFILRRVCDTRRARMSANVGKPALRSRCSASANGGVASAAFAGGAAETALSAFGESDLGAADAIDSTGGVATTAAEPGADAAGGRGAGADAGAPAPSAAQPTRHPATTKAQRNRTNDSVIE